jgi:hypothetical protein
MLVLLRERPEVEWLKIFYRPQNRFADRVFGGFARRVEHPDTSCSRVFEYCVSANDVDAGQSHELSSEGEPFCVRRADAADREAFEREFLCELPWALRAADDLQPEALELPSLSQAYAAVGLERRRELLVASSGGKVVGGALLELSSPGLNLSQLTSSFRVFARAPAVTRALIVSARVRYRELGRVRSVGLADAEQRATFEALGFVFKRRYACWTWHRSLFDPFCDHIREAGK